MCIYKYKIKFFCFFANHTISITIVSTKKKRYDFISQPIEHPFVSIRRKYRSSDAPSRHFGFLSQQTTKPTHLSSSITNTATLCCCCVSSLRSSPSNSPPLIIYPLTSFELTANSSGDEETCPFSLPSCCCCGSIRRRCSTGFPSRTKQHNTLATTTAAVARAHTF